MDTSEDGGDFLPNVSARLVKKLLRHHGEIHNPFNKALFLVGNMALGGLPKPLFWGSSL